MSEQKFSNIVAGIAFLATLAVVVISLVSIIFPMLIVSQTYEFFPDELNPLETSPWLIPIIFSNLILFGFGFAYKKNKLPKSLQNGVRFVLNFEISKKVAVIIGGVIILIYIGLSVEELTFFEGDQFPDWFLMQQALQIWPSTDSLDLHVTEQNTRYVRMLLLDFSQEYLENIKILPFVASILVVIFTALITIQITKKRFAGIIAILVLLQSFTFLEFDTIAVYENFWVLFYLISIYTIQRRWPLSSVSFILAVFTKAFVVTYFFMNIYWIFRAEISKRKKFILLGTYGGVVGVTLAVFQYSRSIYDEVVRIDSSEFFEGFTGWGNSMQFDPLMVLCILPLTIALYIKSRRGFVYADAILVLILGSILAGPFIATITDIYYILPYRFIPFVVFMAMGIGMLFSKEINLKFDKPTNNS